MTTKLGRITAYWYGLMPVKPHELLSGYNLKSLYVHYHSAYGHQTWKAGGLL